MLLSTNDKTIKLWKVRFIAVLRLQNASLPSLGRKTELSLVHILRRSFHHVASSSAVGAVQVFEKKMVTLTGFNTDLTAGGALSSPGWSISARRARHLVQCCAQRYCSRKLRPLPTTSTGDPSLSWCRARTVSLLW